VTSRDGYAGLATRLTGLVVDAALVTVASLAVGSLPPVAWRELVGHDPGWLDTLSASLAGVLPWAYFTVCWTLTGATVGALLVATRTCRGSGAAVGPARAALRALVGLAVAPVWLVGLLGVLTDARRRAWHDRLFGTVVCRRGTA
jgi:uncharacterized RDD family membrane protein YckC